MGEQATKRTRMRGEERREQILSQSKHVFARSSYLEASTSEIARECGITEPMLYKHFGSKKGLFLAILREYGQKFWKEFQSRIQKRAEGSIVDALEHVVEDYRAIIKEDPEINKTFFQAIVEAHDPDIGQAVRFHNRRTYEGIYELVARAQREGFIAQEIDPEAATWGYMSMILASQYGYVLNNDYDVARIQPAVNRIWSRGLLGERSGS